MLNRLLILASACFVLIQSSGEAAMISGEQKLQLVQLAANARQNAYAPYSQFKVGAALITEDGTIYQGCNIENASYGMTVCAERVAVFKAVSEGITDIAAIAVVVPGGGTPCGGCRQVLNEFNPNMLVLLGDEQGNLYAEMVLSDLLPDAFGPHNLSASN